MRSRAFSMPQAEGRKKSPIVRSTFLLSQPRFSDTTHSGGLWQVTEGNTVLLCDQVLEVFSRRSNYSSHGSAREICQMNFGFIASLAIALVGIVSVFAAVPFVSEYAFWVIVAAYVLLAGTRR